jgi:hypothetical protein
MKKYGTIIDSNPLFKLLIVRYFNNPLMTKVNQDFNGKSVYMVEISCMLAKDKRYLIANTLLDDRPIGDKRQLSELEFDILQLKEMYGSPPARLEKHYYSIRENSREEENNTPIFVKKREQKYTEYECPDYGIEITMLHKNNDLYEFPDMATLLSAIEQYNTLIFIK